jgi:hypothetical protein
MRDRRHEPPKDDPPPSSLPHGATLPTEPAIATHRFRHAEVNEPAIKCPEASIPQVKAFHRMPNVTRTLVGAKIIRWEEGEVGVEYIYDDGGTECRQMPQGQAEQELKRIGEKMPIVRGTHDSNPSGDLSLFLQTEK